MEEETQESELTTTDERFEEDIETEEPYDDVLFKMIHEGPKEEDAELSSYNEWEAEEEYEPDWEKEAKKHIQIELDEPPVERRPTIYDLPSYASSGPSISDILRLSVPEIEPVKKIRYSISIGMPGIARLDLSPLTQKIVGCVIGEDVTTEYPWVHVKKDIIEDNIDLHSESSDFLPMKEEIHAFPDTKMLIGYAPSLQEKGQFYICLTVEGRNAVERFIQSQREEHESRVRNAVYKSAGPWYDYGSGAEVDAFIVKHTRPLFEIEVTSTAELLNVPMNLTDRKADDQRDGYIELQPSLRETFENVWRKLVSRSMQVMPFARHSEAQTGPSISANSWLQYLYEYKTVDLSTYTEDKTDSLKDFLLRYTDEMCDQILMNSMWDIYESDYLNLVHFEKDTQPPVPIRYKEHQSYYDSKITVDKVINDLCWHPFWTGIAFAAYTTYSKSEYLTELKTNYDELRLADADNRRVLVWSFTDPLTPKLTLECPREVTSVTVCPLDHSIVVGGCTNGQVVIWHIPGKIEQVEAVVTQTDAQIKYNIVLKSLMTWMRETKVMSVIHPVAISSLKHSQKASIAKIVWVSPHFKIDKNGRITPLPEDAPLDDLNSQFVTASYDGTIAFWDLKSKPAEKIQRGPKKKKRSEIMMKPVSPFKILDRVFKPEYMLVVQYPDENRRLVTTVLSLYNPKFRKEQIEPFPLKDDVTVRKYYRAIIEKPPDYIMEPKILVGTVDGDVGCVTWDGYEFATEVSVNRETVRWVWIKKIHDGPVTHLIRSLYYHKTVASVGGHIFAVWRDDYNEPLIWKKANIRYTSCSWGIIRPTVLILMRMDGTAEIWDFIVKSHEPTLTQSVSGRIITGIYTHELPLEPQCIGFCDFTGSLRMFMAPPVLLTYDVADVEWLKKFIDRQVQRIEEFKIWQQEWAEANQEAIELKKQLAEMDEERMRLKEDVRIDLVPEITPLEPPIERRRPWQFLEESKARWMSMEVKRMQRVILEQKGLRKDVLEKQRAPVMKLRQEARTKKRKLREIMNLQDKIFDESIMFLFPEHKEPKEVVLPPLLVPLMDRRLTIDELIKHEITLKQEGAFVDPDEEIIFNFLEVQTEALTKIKKEPFDRVFDWRQVFATRRMKVK